MFSKKKKNTGNEWNWIHCGALLIKLTDHSVHLVPNCRFLSSRGLEIRGPSQIKPSGSGDENDHFQPILPTCSPMLPIIINMMFRKRIIFLPLNSYRFVYIVVTFIVRISTQPCGHGYCLELTLWDRLVPRAWRLMDSMGSLKLITKPNRRREGPFLGSSQSTLRARWFPAIVHETGEEVVKETIDTCFFFHGKPQNVVYSRTRLQFHVAVVSNLARRSFFSAAMLFLSKSKCIAFVQKT